MPSVQDTYTQFHGRALEGMVPNGELNNIVSRVVENSGGIGFGKAAFYGTVEDSCRAAAASAVFLGVTVLDRTQPADLYAKGATAGVLTQGPVWVLVTEAVTVGSAAYYTAADGTFSDTSTGNVAVPGGRFETATSGAGLALLRLS